MLEADITVGKGTDEEDGAAAHGGLLFRTSKDKETGEYNGYYFALDILKQQVALVKLSADGWNEIATKKMSIISCDNSCGRRSYHLLYGL